MKVKGITLLGNLCFLDGHRIEPIAFELQLGGEVEIEQPASLVALVFDGRSLPTQMRNSETAALQEESNLHPGISLISLKPERVLGLAVGERLHCRKKDDLQVWLHVC